MRSSGQPRLLGGAQPCIQRTEVRCAFTAPPATTISSDRVRPVTSAHGTSRRYQHLVDTSYVEGRAVCLRSARPSHFDRQRTRLAFVRVEDRRLNLFRQCARSLLPGPRRVQRLRRRSFRNPPTLERDRAEKQAPRPVAGSPLVVISVSDRSIGRRSPQSPASSQASG